MSNVGATCVKPMNKFGLTRDIPEKVKREVRKRSGFGCVICGKAIYEYEHFDPDYIDAFEHNPDGITLLCLEHHGKKTKGFISRDTIQMGILNPAAKQHGFSFDAFDVGTRHPEVFIGTFRGENLGVVLRILGEDIISVLPPEIEGGPFRINATLKDRNGRTILDIAENEWRTPTDNWDVEIKGARITIRSAPQMVDLVIRTEPPNRLVFEKLQLVHRDVKVEANEGKNILVVHGETTIESSGCHCVGCKIGIEVDTEGISLGVGGGSIKFSGVIGGRLSDSARFPIDSSVRTDNKAPTDVDALKMIEDIRRNAPCPCGSGRRYKKCHGSLL